MPIRVTAPGQRANAFETLSLFEFVPWVTGTDRVDLVGPGNKLLKKITAGSSPPALNVTTPGAGSLQSGPTVTVTWNAADGEGDPLSFRVLYSPDNGQTWENASLPTTDSSVQIPTGNLMASDTARFRVMASDGVHTKAATSPQFRVPNHVPELTILTPEGGTTVVAGQTVGFSGFAYDADLGSMPDETLSWSSNRDGLLGGGDQLSTASLSPGQHTVTFKADDGKGGVAGKTLQIIVVSNPAQLPHAPNALVGAPSPVILQPVGNLSSREVNISNQNPLVSLHWEASVDKPWIKLDADSGRTPAAVKVTFNNPKLKPGRYAASLTVTSTEGPGIETVIPIRVTVRGSIQHAPLLMR